MKRLMAAIRSARAIGSEVSESGQPRGERRIYTLRMADGKLLETPDLGRIEKRIAKLQADPNAPAPAPVKKPKTAPPAANANTVRQVAHLGRLADSGGKPVRVDTAGADLALLDALVTDGYAPSRAETYRKAMREAAARRMKRK